MDFMIPLDALLTQRSNTLTLFHSCIPAATEAGEGGKFSGGTGNAGNSQCRHVPRNPRHAGTSVILPFTDLLRLSIRTTRPIVVFALSTTGAWAVPSNAHNDGAPACSIFNHNLIHTLAIENFRQVLVNK